MRTLILALLAAAVFAACTSGGNSGPAASPTPSAGATGVAQYDTTVAQPANCVQKTDGFRYWDMLTQTPMPVLQNYTPYPGYPINLHIHYYTAQPTGLPSGSPQVSPVAIEVTPSAGAVPNTTPKPFDAVPMVPIIDADFSNSTIFGLRDTATVTVMPHGSLSSEYQWDLIYRANQDNNANSMANAIAAGQNPTPIPTVLADYNRDQLFQTQGVPAVTALGRGGSVDDRYFKGTIVQYLLTYDPHPKIMACDWLENRQYDILLTVLRKRAISPSAYASMQASMQQQNAPSNIMDSAGYEAYEKDTWITTSPVTPQLWDPAKAKDFSDSDVYINTVYYPVKLLTSIQLPTPDQTTGP